MDPLTAQTLRQPERARGLDGPAWTELIGQASAAGLLARVASRLRVVGVWDEIPDGPRRHLRSAEVLAARQRAQATFEIAAVGRALAGLAGPVVLLKGAAYLALEHSAAAGRLLSDIDVMVPREMIGQAESALMMAGWVSAESDAYNQRYYREWMHEIPPMRHIQRGTVVDLHHTIVPPTARPNLNAGLLFRAAVPVPAFPGVHVLSAEDRVIHAATHLFHDGDLSRGLRDLSDIASLIEHDGGDATGFSARLSRRAETLGLSDELHYALHFASAWFGLDLEAVPPKALLRWAFERALMPEHSSCEDRWTPLARSLIYLRSHWLRMPVHLLVPHLTRKFRMRLDANAGAETRRPAA